LLQELQENAQREAVEQLILAHGEDVAELSSAATSLLEGEFDTAEFSADFRIVQVESLECSQRRTSFLDTALIDKPSRTLGDGENGSQRDQGDQSRDGKRQTPLNRLIAGFEEPKVDPCFEEVP
jgi:hypothetical protein